MAKPMRPLAVLPDGAEAAADAALPLLVLTRLRKDFGAAVGTGFLS